MGRTVRASCPARPVRRVAPGSHVFEIVTVTPMFGGGVFGRRRGQLLAVLVHSVDTMQVYRGGVRYQ